MNKVCLEEPGYQYIEEDISSIMSPESVEIDHCSETVVQPIHIPQNVISEPEQITAHTNTIRLCIPRPRPIVNEHNDQNMRTGRSIGDQNIRSVQIEGGVQQFPPKVNMLVGSLPSDDIDNMQLIMNISNTYKEFVMDKLLKPMYENKHIDILRALCSSVDMKPYEHIAIIAYVGEIESMLDGYMENEITMRAKNKSRSDGALVYNDELISDMYERAKSLKKEFSFDLGPNDVIEISVTLSDMIEQINFLIGENDQAINDIIESKLTTQYVMLMSNYHNYNKAIKSRGHLKYQGEELRKGVEAMKLAISHGLDEYKHSKIAQNKKKKNKPTIKKTGKFTKPAIITMLHQSLFNTESSDNEDTESVSSSNENLYSLNDIREVLDQRRKATHRNHEASEEVGTRRKRKVTDLQSRLGGVEEALKKYNKK